VAVDLDSGSTSLPNQLACSLYVKALRTLNIAAENNAILKSHSHCTHEGIQMGRQRNSKKQRRPVGRRDFLRRSGAAMLAAASIPLLQACGGSSSDNPSDSGSTTPQPGPASFLHSVASGDPLSNAVILWTRVTPPGNSSAAVTVDFSVATDPAMTAIVKTGRVSTDASRDYTVKIDADGLQPNTTYYYRFSVAGVQSPVGRTKTLPVGDTGRLRLAVVSCSSLAHGYFNAYRRIAERADLDLVVHLGDYIYEYGSGEYGDVRSYEPANEILTLSDYRTRHAQYKRDADLQEVHRQHPMVAMWDDHEVANDAWSGGAGNHTEGVEGTWAARVAAALQAYYEWMPVRVVDPANLRKSNRSFALGNLVDLIMLEERFNARSKQITRNAINVASFTQTGELLDPARQMLGTDGESWLATRLRSSTAKWKLVGQGVMFAQLKAVPGVVADGGGTFLNPDQWDGYQPARDRVYDILKGNATTPAVGNVVILTGDIHSSWAADLSQDPNNSDVAAGGYDPDTGAGSHAVELVVTSATSPGAIDPQGTAAAALQLANPHFKYVDLERRGYMLLDVDATRVVSEWWYVDTVASRSGVQSLGRALQVSAGANHLVGGAQTTARPNPPALAP
jgi:alkaline phosphatase D